MTFYKVQVKQRSENTINNLDFFLFYYQRYKKKTIYTYLIKITLFDYIPELTFMINDILMLFYY